MSSTERTAEDVKLRPIRGDEIRTVSYCVLIEDADDQNVSYRWVDVDHDEDMWSRIHLTSINGYRQWPIAEVIHIAQPKEKTDG